MTSSSALTLLTSRPAWTLQLLTALEDASVDKKLVSSENVRSMKKLPNSPASNEIIRLTPKSGPISGRRAAPNWSRKFTG